MKFLLNLLFIFSISLNSQDFETHYKKATKDYENGIYESNEINKAIEFCPDISKYPDLLIYKASLLEFNNEKLLAAKYGNLALSLAKKKKDSLLALDFLGYIYSFSDDLKKSTSYYKEALLLAKELNLNERIEEIKFNILLKNFDQAKDKKQPLQKLIDFYLSLPKTKNLEEKLSYLMVIVDLSKGNLMLNQFEELKNSIHKKFDKNSLEPYFLGQYYFSYSILESYSKNYEKALKYNDSSYSISKKSLTKESILNNFYIYKNLYQEIDKPNIALKYTDSILKIEEEFKTLEFESGLKIIDENILFKKVKEQTEIKISSYKTIILFVSIVVILILILFFVRRKKHLENLKQLSSDLRINKGKYNESLKDNIEFKKEIKELLKAKKFDEISKLYKKHEIEDINNETYITYLASDISPSFLKKLEKHTFTFSDIEKTLLYYRKNNHTNKEIALITNRTLRSIQSLFYRLNKKIQLKTNQNISDFLENL